MKFCECGKETNIRIDGEWICEECEEEREKYGTDRINKWEKTNKKDNCRKMKKGYD